VALNEIKSFARKSKHLIAARNEKGNFPFQTVPWTEQARGVDLNPCYAENKEQIEIMLSQ